MCGHETTIMDTVVHDPIAFARDMHQRSSGISDRTVFQLIVIANHVDAPFALTLD
ncbi:hypothetical protein D3C85_1217640 [compost metagenome]